MRFDNGNIIFFNRSIDNGLNGAAPDAFSENPSDNFVLCRDENGIPTAVYGSDVWDLNPYRLSAKQLDKITFSSITTDCKDVVFCDRLITEVKHILYHIMYFSGSGVTGRISASTLGQYFYNLKSLAGFCIRQLDNDLAKGITIIDVLSNVSYTKAYLAREGATNFTKKQTSALLTVLNQIGSERIGFLSCSKTELDFEREEDKQHPVIPSRIYLSIMTRIDEVVDTIYPYKEKIESLIIAMEDRNYGAAFATQKTRLSAKLERQPTMEEAIVVHGLDDLYLGVLPLPKI